MDELKNVVVIGASAGGLQAITKLIGSFPDGDHCAVFVVLHVSKNSAGDIITYHLQKHTSLVCKIPADKEQIKKGHIYIAPPDHHMLVKESTIRISQGPTENRWRPSIDVLFRSAAANYNSKVIGIILSGLLDDGTSGMSAIKRSGGIAIVQEPEDADFPDMPNNVINNVPIDHRVPISDMRYVLGDLFSKPVSAKKNIPEEVKIEAEITEKMASKIDDLAKIGTHTVLTCPDCGGGLWEIKDDAVYRYRCFTGHVFTEKILLEQQTDALEETLWVALRMMEERRNLLKISASHDYKAGYGSNEQGKLNQAESLQSHIERLKTVLINLKKSNNS